MPETKEITVYKFEELSDTAKCKAKDDWAQVMDFDPDYIIDDFKEQGKARGFAIEHIQWEGFGTQSDNAVWQGSVDIGEFIDYHLKDNNPHHARYVVLRELIRDGWVEMYTSVAYRGFRYTRSAVTEIDGGALWNLVENHNDGEPALIRCESILKGASVRDLATGIDHEDLLVRLQEWIEDEVKNYEHDIFKALEAEYEWETGFENFAELAEANEWRFDETGKLV